MNKASFWQKNQVLISAMAGALTLVLQQFLVATVIDYKALGLAALTAIAGIIGNEFRGKGQSIMGIIGVVAMAFQSIASTGTISWEKLMFGIMIGVLALASAPFKSIGYEKTDIIKEAKKEGEQDVPTPLSPKPDAIVN